MLEFIEDNPSVAKGLDRRLIFPQIRWITLDKFEQLLNSSPDSIHPYLLDQTTKSNKRLYIGKLIPNLTDETNVELSELIGNVQFDTNSNKWQLNISFNTHVFTVDKNFLILQIPDLNSYYWSKNKEDNSFYLYESKIPKHAYKAALHKLDSKYSYIGRTIPDLNETKRPKFYANSWLIFDIELQQSFGRVNETYNLLFVPATDIEVGHDLFEVLCLKATSASLKTLCQLKCRQYFEYSQAKIKAINQNGKLIPDCLIQYLQYPSCLKSGQYLLSNEKLVDKNDSYEMFINKENSLICRCLKTNAEIVIAQDLTTILFHRFQCVFYNQNNSVAKVFHITDNPEYKFSLQWEQGGYSFENLF